VSQTGTQNLDRTELVTAERGPARNDHSNILPAGDAARTGAFRAGIIAWVPKRIRPIEEMARARNRDSCFGQVLDVTLTDTDTVERSLSEPQLFAAIFERHFVAIHGYFARRGAHSDADDLVP